MKIAVDAMGGDNAPQAIIEGVLKAKATLLDVEFVLFGQQEQIMKYLSDDEDRITIIDAREVITMEDEPVKSIRKKKNSSLVLASESLKNGETDALFSSGNSGALLVAGLFIVGRIPGLDRPAMITLFPKFNKNNGFVTVLDVGANAESTVANLHEFAVLGKFYCQYLLKISNPKIKLLNNGTEWDKGDRIHKEAYQILDQDSNLNFLGNIEARDILNDETDVVVTDGFTGNAVLKTTEGTALNLMSAIKNEINHNFVSKLGGMLLKKSFKSIYQQLDYEKHGGAILLGVKKPIIKAHGSSNVDSVSQALIQSHDMVKSEITNNLTQYFSEMQ